MELEQGEAADVGGRGHLIERRVHEHAGELDAPVQLRPDRLGLLQACSTRGLPGQKIIPSAQAPRSAARWASSRAVIPQILTRVIARLSWQARR